MWPFLLGTLHFILVLVASGHAVLCKRDSRAAVLWVGVIWLVPFVGPILYLAFGINRLRRQFPYEPLPPDDTPIPQLPPRVVHLNLLKRLVDGVTGRPLTTGNEVEPLLNGDEAYPAMLAAIAEARETITLSTYIFDPGKAGRAFVEALREAVARGVDVRVLVDDTGARYSFPTIFPDLKRAGVPAARFRPTFAPVRFMAINLRNHRKILIADGRTAFTGGINIRDGHMLKSRPKRAVQDLQFRIRGPVVAQLQEVFAADWHFATGEGLQGESWFPELEHSGPVVARGIADGPDEDFEKLLWTILGGLATAQSHVQIITPYFIPDRSVISALNLAAMRGVTVDIILPEKSNLPFVQWACFAQLWQVLERGCRVWLTPLPFDHSKLMLVDGFWTLLGSANWDTRSLRLNFEFNMECYDEQLANRMKAIVDRKLQHARRITLEDVDSRPLGIRLRDGVARLFAPYL